MPTVLVVEDQAESRRPMAKLLRLEGYDVITARDAYSAGAAIRQHSPDLVLLDVGIPPMDGLTMLAILYQDPSFEHVPVVVVTGQADDNTQARAQQLGVKCCLIKSRYTPEDLLDTVRRHVRKQEQVGGSSQ